MASRDRPDQSPQTQTTSYLARTLCLTARPLVSPNRDFLCASRMKPDQRDNLGTLNQRRTFFSPERRTPSSEFLPHPCSSLEPQPAKNQIKTNLGNPSSSMGPMHHILLCRCPVGMLAVLQIYFIGDREILRNSTKAYSSPNARPMIPFPLTASQLPQ